MGIQLGSAFGKVVIDSSGATKGVAQAQQAISSLGGSLGGLSGIIANAFSFAGAQLFISGISSAIGAVRGLIGTASESYAANERLSMSLESLTARELKSAGAAGSLSEALALAGPKAKELLGWTEQLAIKSPFNQAGVAQAFKMAQAYGFVSSAGLNLATGQEGIADAQRQGIVSADRLTKALIDQAAATGGNEETMNGLALAMGQMRAKGKVSAEELNQLRERGADVNSVLAGMGFNLDDVSKGLVNADAFILRLVETMEADFGGAAERQSATWTGLLNSLEDLKAIGLREFFSGTFKAIQPLVSKFVDSLSGEGIRANIRGIGDTLGKSIGGALAYVQGLFAKFQKFGLGAVFASFGLKGGATFFKKLGTLFNQLSGNASSLSDTLRATLGPVFTWLSENLFPSLSRALQFVLDNFETIKGAVIAIGAVLAGAAIVSAIAGVAAAVASLVTPIGIIVAAAGLLGAAWAGNWGNIQGITRAAWVAIQPTLQQLGQWLSATIPAAVQALSNVWNGILLPGFMRVWEAIQTNLFPIFQQLFTWLGSQGPGVTQALSTAWSGFLLPALQTVGDFLLNTLFPAWANLQVWLAQNIPAALQTLSNFWNQTLLPAITAVSDYIQNYTIPFFSSVANLAGAVLGKALEALAGLWQNTLLPALTAVWDFISSSLSPVFEALGAMIGDTVSPALDNLSSSILPSLSSGLEGLKSFISDLTSTFNGWADAVKNFQLPPSLQANSPTPFEMGLRGISDTIASMPELSLPSTANLAAIAAPAAVAGRDGGTTVNNTFSGTINVNGASDPKATAAEVERKLQQMFNRATAGAVG
ncbi:MAG: tape measure protein [Anaerolineae bacterium]|nr:tape measure protein [Anaerolineae bacterium]